MLHFLLCDLPEAMNEVHYELIQAMLEADPTLPSRPAYHRTDLIQQEHDKANSKTTYTLSEPTGSTPLHCLVYELFGCVLVQASETRYMVQVLKLMLRIDPKSAQVYNKFGLLPLHNAILSSRHAGSLIRSNPKRFQKSFRYLIDCYPQACKERDMNGDANGCLPLHLLCMHAAMYGESSRYAAEQLLSVHPDAASQFGGKGRKYPLHFIVN